MNYIVILTMAALIMQIGCRKEESLAEENRKRSEQDAIYRAQYYFDIDNEESACARIGKVAEGFEVQLQNCSLHDRDYMTISASHNGEVQGREFIMSDLTNSYSQNLQLFGDIREQALAKFYRKLVEVIIYARYVDAAEGPDNTD